MQYVGRHNGIKDHYSSDMISRVSGIKLPTCRHKASAPCGYTGQAHLKAVCNPERVNQHDRAVHSMAVVQYLHQTMKWGVR